MRIMFLKATARADIGDIVEVRSSDKEYLYYFNKNHEYGGIARSLEGTFFLLEEENIHDSPPKTSNSSNLPNPSNSSNLPKTSKTSKTPNPSTKTLIEPKASTQNLIAENRRLRRYLRMFADRKNWDTRGAFTSWEWAVWKCDLGRCDNPWLFAQKALKGRDN